MGRGKEEEEQTTDGGEAEDNTTASVVDSGDDVIADVQPGHGKSNAVKAKTQEVEREGLRRSGRLQGARAKGEVSESAAEEMKKAAAMREGRDSNAKKENVKGGDAEDSGGHEGEGHAATITAEWQSLWANKRSLKANEKHVAEMTEAIMTAGTSDELPGRVEKVLGQRWEKIEGEWEGGSGSRGGSSLGKAGECLSFLVKIDGCSYRQAVWVPHAVLQEECPRQLASYLQKNGVARRAEEQGRTGGKELAFDPRWLLVSRRALASSLT